MKDLLCKEHYYYKMHTLLMKSSTYPLLKTTSYNPIRITPPFLQENLESTPSMTLQKSQPLLINKGGCSHYLLCNHSPSFESFSVLNKEN